jgi:hypothetical protein
MLAVVVAAAPAPAATISTVNSVADLDLVDVITAVSFRDGQNDFIGGVNFWGCVANASAGSDPHVSNTAPNAIQGAGANPAITGPDAPQLAWALQSKIYGAASYNVNVVIPNGTYQVRLLLHDGWLGARSADITIEGSMTASSVEWCPTAPTKLISNGRQMALAPTHT